MRKIKVLHIVTRLIVGGAQDLALCLASKLDRERFDITFASGMQDFNKEMADKWDIKVELIPSLAREINPIKDLIGLLKIYSFIKKNKFDIVHTHTSKAGILGRLAAKLAGVPIIFHMPHGCIFHPVYYGPGMIFLLSRIENFVASFTDKIINCADNEKKDFLKHKISSEDKYITVRYGIIQDSFLKAYDRNLKRKELNIPQDTVLIGTIARLVPEKGHIFCLEAFKLAVEILPNAMLLIAGDGKLRSDIEAKIKELDLSDNVLMLGHRNDVPELLSCLDISIHTSRWEGTPLAIIEAMLMGKAIIATKVGGIPELINDSKTGIIVRSGDRGELAKAIIKLAKDKMLREELGSAARIYAQSEFTIDLMVKNITKLYDNFINTKITQ